MLRRMVALSVVVIALASPSVSRAQGVFPGGWAPQFGYQAIAGPGAVGFGAGVTFGTGVPGFGYGYGAPYGYGYGSPYGFGGMTPYGPAGGFAGYPGNLTGLPPAGIGSALPPPALTVNGLDPLTQAIRQSTRRRGR